MSQEELFRMAVRMTEQFVANRDIGGPLKDPEDAVGDYIVRMHKAIQRSWLEVGGSDNGT